jgi:hypothetical protein
MISHLLGKVPPWSAPPAMGDLLGDEWPGNEKTEGLTSSPGGCGRYRIRGMQMRRVITFVLVVGLTYAGLAAFAPAHPGAGSATAAVVHLTAQASRPGFKVVRFAGYTINVPASWPVYRLDRDPSRCIRYDRHAVYLGQPGANQDCPAHLVGRTTTISIQATGLIAGPASSVAAPVGTGAAIGALPQVGGSVMRNAQDQEMGTSLANPGLSVTGTYTGGGRGVLAILRSLRRGDSHLSQAGVAPVRARVLKGSSGAALLFAPLSALPQGTVTVPRATATLDASPATQPGRPHPHKGRHHKGRHHRQARKHKGSKHKGSKHRGSRHKRSRHKAGKRHAHKHRARHHRARHHRARHHRARHRRARHHRARHHRSHPRTPRLRVARHGFDSCTTPSLAAMRAWRRTFSAMGVYIGGVEAGCAAPNLSAGWVRAVTGLGWALMPTYVGRQASCSPYSVRIRPAHAVAQGHAAALDAIRQAAALGMGRGTPVYYDMEAYHGHRRCKDAALAFLDAWTRTLHAHGYSSGVYSSASSGAENLGWAHQVHGHRIAEPDSMWFGLWDNEQNVRGLPYLLTSWWRGARRIKQYEGPHRRRVGGYTLDIDSDWVYGAVYR